MALDFHYNIFFTVFSYLIAQYSPYHYGISNLFSYQSKYDLTSNISAVKGHPLLKCPEIYFLENLNLKQFCRLIFLVSKFPAWII